MQHRMAHQGEGAGNHRPSAESEEFVAHPIGDGAPERPVGFRRNGRLDPGRQSHGRQQVVGGHPFPPQAIERLLDEDRRDHPALRRQQLRRQRLGCVGDGSFAELW